jgi:uncharacterized membrane protein (UPF0127 family)
MVFPFEQPRYASFWMKNTLIPLDMIFVRADGSIANIEANTVPLSLQLVFSDEPVAAVLEIAGGRSAELGIQPGDKVKW